MKFRKRRLFVVLATFAGMVGWFLMSPNSYESVFLPIEDTGAETEIEGEFLESKNESGSSGLALELLEELEVKGRAPKTGYSREKFYPDWPLVNGCSLRQRILRRELGDMAIMDDCNVIAGEFDEPYTGEHLVLNNREEVSKIQIDHVVALSDAWQKGAQYMDYETRNKIATDPLNLLAVDGEANKQKSDGDAATWLPSNKKFRCQYVARQVSVKYKYGLWVTQAEKDAISRVLSSCPNEPSVGI